MSGFDVKDLAFELGVYEGKKCYLDCYPYSPDLISVLKENASANRADPPKIGMFPIMRITENLLV